MQSILSYLVEAAYPDAGRDGAAVPEPVRTLRLLGLIRTLIDYGKHLIVTARMQAGTPGFLAFAKTFGTASLKLLIARIGCAISRAVHLEQKLGGTAPAGGPRRPVTTRRAPRARPAAPATRAQVRPAGPAQDPELAHLPTVAQIVAEIRRHPMEQVIATICRDLGITPEHALWQQLDQALASFGVRLAVAPAQAEARPPRSGGAQPHAGEPRAGEPHARQPHAEPRAAAAQPVGPAEGPRAQSPPHIGPPVPADLRIAA